MKPTLPSLAALGASARLLALVTLASLGLGGCCGGQTESRGPSFRAPAAEKTASAPRATPPEGETVAPPASPPPTIALPARSDRALNLARQLGKLRVDPNGPKFASATLLTTHYRKHGVEMGFASEEDYLAAAQALVTRGDAERFRRKSDQLYFRASTGEFGVVSARGALRTYFVPNDPSGYWQRQRDEKNPRDDDEPRGLRER